MVISALLAVTYSQKHTYSLKTVIKHEQPRNDYNTHAQHIPIHEQQAAPVHEVQEPTYNSGPAVSHEEPQDYQKYLEQHFAQYYNLDHDSVPAYNYVPSQHESQNLQTANAEEYKQQQFVAPSQGKSFTLQGKPQQNQGNAEQHQIQPLHTSVAPNIESIPHHKYAALHHAIATNQKENAETSAVSDESDHHVDYYVSKFEYIKYLKFK